MKASDEIDITGDLVASSFCNAKLTINKDVVTITPNVRSYLFEWGLHIFCWTVCIFMSAKVWQLEVRLPVARDDSLRVSGLMRTREGLQGQVGGGLHQELAAVEGK